MAEGRRHATLGGFTFRIDPDAVSYPYQIDYSVIDTLGGQVIQVLGATTGDLTVTASFGEARREDLKSWQLAEKFHKHVKALMDAQADFTQGRGHRPVKFTYHDGVHDWDFKVLIKGIADADGNGSINHSTGKFNYEYQLTLFVVQDRSLHLKKITTDKFISRISNGMGWKASGFNGSLLMQDAIDFIRNHSTDGTFEGYIGKILGFTDTSTGGSSTGSQDGGGVPKAGNIPAGTKIIDIARQAGFTSYAGPGTNNRPADELITAISMGESGGNGNAYNDNPSTQDLSYGLLQINMYQDLGPARRQQFGISRNEELWNPLVNMECGFKMAGGGKDFGAWGIGPNAYAGSNNQEGQQDGWIDHFGDLDVKVYYSKDQSGTNR